MPYWRWVFTCCCVGQRPRFHYPAHYKRVQNSPDFALHLFRGLHVPMRLTELDKGGTAQLFQKLSDRSHSFEHRNIIFALFGARPRSRSPPAVLHKLTLEIIMCKRARQSLVTRVFLDEQYRRRKQMIWNLPEAASAIRQLQDVAISWDPKKMTPLLGEAGCRLPRLPVAVSVEPYVRLARFRPLTSPSPLRLHTTLLQDPLP